MYADCRVSSTQNIIWKGAYTAAQSFLMPYKTIVIFFYEFLRLHWKKVKYHAQVVLVQAALEHPSQQWLGGLDQKSQIKYASCWGPQTQTSK